MPLFVKPTHDFGKAIVAADVFPFETTRIQIVGSVPRGGRGASVRFRHALKIGS
jgi:hypothetical protein